MPTQLGKAISLASRVFENTLDKGGSPYILHCIEVMNNVGDDIELQQIAVLHDVIEDTDMTFNDLSVAGFSDRVIVALKLLTHDRSISYDDYIDNLSVNKDAVIVKMADLRHNSDIHRMKGLRKKDFERLAKYHRSYAFLKTLVMHRG